MSGTHGRLDVVRRVVRTPALRRLEAAFFGFSLAENATWLAALVYAFERTGIGGAGLLVVLQLLPAVVAAPFAASAGDRFRPDRALAFGYVVQAAAMALAAVGMAAGLPVLAYVGAAATATAVTFTRPVMGALLPAVTHAPSDLVAANVVSGSVGEIGALLGPVIGGVLIGVGSPTWVFVAAAVVSGLGAVLVARVDRDGALFVRPTQLGSGAVVAHVLGGFRVLRRDAGIRALVGLTAVGALVIGTADLLAVVFVDARLAGGGGQVGALAGSLGLGALAGAVAASGLATTRRIGWYFGVGGLLLGIPFVALAAIDSVGPALAAFAALGLGEALLMTTASVVIQRRCDMTNLARIFGIVEGLRMGAIAVGSTLFSVVAARWTLGRALVVVAAAVLLLVLVGCVRVVATGAGQPMVDPAIVERLLADPIFAPLPAPAIERAARRAERRSVAAGTSVITQGEPGDGYYLVVAGRFEVFIDGELRRVVEHEAGFGEIALVRDLPRTATVVAVADGEVLFVGREEFLEAVTGHPRSFVTAAAVADDYLPH